MPTIDQKQDATAQWLVGQLRHGAPGRSALWSLAGAVGSGKTSVLCLVAQSLQSHGLIPVVISAPTGEVDAAAIALLETAGQLKAAALLNGEVSTLSDPARSWNDKMAAMTAALDEHHEKVVILCDEPTRWYHRHQSLVDDTPDFCARAFAEWIAKEAKCRRVISGRIPDDVPCRLQTKAPRLDDGREFLDEYDQWGETRDFADALRQHLSGPIPFRSLWEIKLCVALLMFKSPVEVASQAMSSVPADLLLNELLDLVEGGSSYEPLCTALARLALARTPIDRSAFLSLTNDLLPLDRSIIDECLSHWDAGRFALHPLVRHEIVMRARDPRRLETNAKWRLAVADRRQVHQRLKNEYHSAGSFRNQLESLHHELLGGEAVLPTSDVRLRFVEQLHEIGRTLSYVHHEHRRATELFRLALQIDPQNSYSHHYLAFNLDWLAEKQDEVEKGYRRAIDLQSTHPWWWSRWISYLATRGRFREARSEWQKALDAMSVSEDGSPRWLYLSLHRWVARWLLHWAELDFAEDVLRSIPTEVSAADNSIQALWDLLKALRIAEQGVAVFPLTVPETEWWSSNGHTGLPLSWQNEPMRCWKPARVQSVDDESGRLLLIATEWPSTTSAPLEFHEVELKRADLEEAAQEFNWRDLSEGRFLELAYYGNDSILRIGLHRAREWRDRRLIPLVPPPDRWFEHAVKAAWQLTAEVS